jgi:ABC-type Fe3+-siderophore transport system permease subunit
LRLKKVILSAFITMILGTVLELYLLHHYESIYQLIPILCIGAVLLTAVVLFFRRTKRVKSIFSLVLVVTALSGFYGGYLHLYANYEFEVEMRTTATTWDLVSESLSGALPTLAPFSMIVLALLGYSYLILINQKQ